MYYFIKYYWYIIYLFIALTFGLVGCSGTKTTTTADTTKPVINGLDDMETSYNVGDAMPDWTNGITATDNADGNLTSQITVDSSDVNMAVPGTYSVNYSVKDKAGNEDSESLDINVVAAEGTRFNPIEFGTSYTISVTDDLFYGDYQLQVTVNSQTRGQDAEDMVMNENQFNSPSGDNQEYVITNVTVKLISTDESKSLYQSSGFSYWGDFMYVNTQGKMYDASISAVIPNDLDDCSLYVGNSCTGNIVNLVDNNDPVLLKYNTTWFKTSTDDVNFTMPQDETPNADYGTQSNPVPLGQAQVVNVSYMLKNYKIKVKVNSVTRGQDAEDMVMNENEFNTPSGDTQEYIIVNYTITLLSYDELSDFYNANGYNTLNGASFVSATSGAYTDVTTVIPNDINDYALYVGGTATGNASELITLNDDVFLKVGNTWFSLSE